MVATAGALGPAGGVALWLFESDTASATPDPANATASAMRPMTQRRFTDARWRRWWARVDGVLSIVISEPVTSGAPRGAPAAAIAPDEVTPVRASVAVSRAERAAGNGGTGVSSSRMARARSSADSARVSSAPSAAPGWSSPSDAGVRGSVSSGIDSSWDPPPRPDASRRAGDVALVQPWRGVAGRAEATAGLPAHQGSVQVDAGNCAVCGTARPMAGIVRHRVPSSSAFAPPGAPVGPPVGLEGHRRRLRWVCELGAIGPDHRRARAFGAFGQGSLIAFPPGAVFNERWIRIGSHTMIGPYVSLSAGMAPGQEMVSDPVVSIGDRTLIGRGSHIVGHFCIEIGDDIQTGPYVYITDQNHVYSATPTYPSARSGPSSRACTSGRGAGSARVWWCCRAAASGATSPSGPARWSPAISPTTAWPWARPPSREAYPTTAARPVAGAEPPLRSWRVATGSWRRRRRRAPPARPPLPPRRPPSAARVVVAVAQRRTRR